MKPQQLIELLNTSMTMRSLHEQGQHKKIQVLATVGIEWISMQC